MSDPAVPVSPPDPTAVEVVYVAPSNVRGSAVAVASALALTVGVLWIVVRVLHSVSTAGIAVGICLAVFAVGALARRQHLLRPRRVLADRTSRTVHIEHRRGVEVIRFEDCGTITQEAPVMSDGIALDTVVITRTDGRRVAFSVLDRAAAEGTVRALHAVMALPHEATPTGSANVPS